MTARILNGSKTEDMNMEATINVIQLLSGNN